MTTMNVQDRHGITVDTSNGIVTVCINAATRSRDTLHPGDIRSDAEYLFIHRGHHNVTLVRGRTGWEPEQPAEPWMREPITQPNGITWAYDTVNAAFEADE